MKRYAISFYVLLSIHITTYTSDKGPRVLMTHEVDIKSADEMSNAVRECSPQAYITALGRAKFTNDAMRGYQLRGSLSFLLTKCLNSGNLNALVKANVAAGGSVASADHEAGFVRKFPFFAYDNSALGQLARMRVQNEVLKAVDTPCVSDDIKATIETMAKAGASVDNALLEAVQDGNYDMTHALLSLGANPRRPLATHCWDPVTFASRKHAMNPFDLVEFRVQALRAYKWAALARIDIKAYQEMNAHFKDAVSFRKFFRSKTQETMSKDQNAKK